MSYGQYSFSQAQGYEEIPGPLKLEELPKEARTRIWNLFFAHLSKSMSADTMGLGGPWIGRPWCIAPGFLDSGLTVFASTLPRPARRGRVVPERGFGSRTSPASSARCTSA